MIEIGPRIIQQLRNHLDIVVGAHVDLQRRRGAEGVFQCAVDILQHHTSSAGSGRDATHRSALSTTLTDNSPVESPTEVPPVPASERVEPAAEIRP